MLKKAINKGDLINPLYQAVELTRSETLVFTVNYMCFMILFASNKPKQSLILIVFHIRFFELVPKVGPTH